jgi:flagellar basal body rod protein FlgG
MRALDTAATGMAAQDLKVQAIAGNIANMGTTGFAPSFRTSSTSTCNASALRLLKTATSCRSASKSARA